MWVCDVVLGGGGRGVWGEWWGLMIAMRRLLVLGKCSWNGMERGLERTAVLGAGWLWRTPQGERRGTGNRIAP